MFYKFGHFHMDFWVIFLKVFLFTKKKMILILSCFATSLLAFSFTFSNFISPAKTKKKLPIYNVGREEKIVSISFDAAWGNEQTQNLLDILKKNDVKTTFFLVGMWVDKYPESVKAIFDDGHDIGNHSDTHPHLPKSSADEIKKEIENCNDKVEKITGKRPILFRFPYGDYDNKSIEVLHDLNMYPIQWNIDSLDWMDKKCDEMCNRIIPKLSPGSIILMHNGAKYTPESLDTIINKIKDEGYQIVPISQIIYKDNYNINNLGTQISR